MYAWICGVVGAGRLFTVASLNTRVQGFKRRYSGHSALRFRSSNADFEVGKFRLKMERDSCQRMPCALKQGDNIWEIDVTCEAFILRVCVFVD